jgi:hypothetical protein
MQDPAEKLSPQAMHLLTGSQVKAGMTAEEISPFG